MAEHVSILHERIRNSTVFIVDNSFIAIVKITTTILSMVATSSPSLLISIILT